jgi:putative transposase
MARLARVVAAGVPHHVTQRGNGRQFILACDPDRSVYLDLLPENRGDENRGDGRNFP